jgi:hypothetical protein
MGKRSAPAADHVLRVSGKPGFPLIRVWSSTAGLAPLTRLPAPSSDRNKKPNVVPCSVEPQQLWIVPGLVHPYSHEEHTRRFKVGIPRFIPAHAGNTRGRFNADARFVKYAIARYLLAEMPIGSQVSSGYIFYRRIK